jgi:Glycosyltransferase family 87
MPSIRRFIAVTMLAFAVAFLGFVYSHYATAVSMSDYACYWAQGRLLAQHEDPYDVANVARLEQSVGWRGDPMINRMTPFVFPITLTLGFVSPKLGAAAWSLMIISALMLAVRSLWIMHGKPEGRLHLIGYMFVPALACILAAQGVVIALVGLVLFLRFERTRTFLSGACLALCAIKPHLFVPFGAGFCFLTMANRRYRLLVGVISGIGALGILATLVYPTCWTKYIAMIRNDRIEEQFLPNLSMLFRISVDVRAFWLQFVLTAAAAIWALWYARRHRGHWSWSIHGSLLMLVSVLVAPYSCFTDEVILLPAILIGLYASHAQWRSFLWFGLCEGITLTLLLGGVQITSLYYVWTPVAWLICYCQWQGIGFSRKPQPGSAIEPLRKLA